MEAYVLIETGAGMTKAVCKALTGVPGIKSVDAVTGVYDVIAVLERDDLNAVGNLVTQQVHRIDGVIHTMTCLVVELG